MKLSDWVFLGYSDSYQKKLQVLVANELIPEKWSYTGENDLGILKSYLNFTFEKLWNEREDAPEDEKQKHVYMGDSSACFNTGLYDKSLQPIYFCCKKNPKEGHQPWVFYGFFNSYTIGYAQVPATAALSLQRANYFEEPDKLLFNYSLEIVPQWNHILQDTENRMRLPESLRQNDDFTCRSRIEGAIRTARQRIEANYKTAVPQFFNGEIQLLIPLYLQNGDKPDVAMALALSEDKTVYYGRTCLTTEMAYNNARLIARPDSYWLQA